MVESINSRVGVPAGAPLRNTGPLAAVETAQPATATAATPAVDQSIVRRENITSDGSQADYGDLPWGAPPEGPRVLSAEEINGVIDSHLADPCQINQASPYTCVATTMQRWLASNDKPAYATMMKDLQTKNAAKLPNGDVMSVSEANRAHIDGLNLPPDQHLDMLMQTAVMDYANGEANFDAKTGKHDDGNSGLTVERSKTVFEKIAGNHTILVSDLQGYENVAALIADIKSKTENGQFVCLPLNRGEVNARNTASDIFDSANQNQHAQLMTIDGVTDTSAYDQAMLDAAQAWADAEFTGQMAHVVEISSVDDLGNVTVFDPQQKGFVKLSPKEFEAALRAAIGDDLGGELGSNLTAQTAPPPPPPLKRRPGPGP